MHIDQINETMTVNDSRWLLAYALMVSLVDDLAFCYRAGLWKDDPLECLLSRNTRIDVNDHPRGMRFYSWDVAREWNSHQLDKLCNFIEVSTNGTIIVNKEILAWRAKNTASLGGKRASARRGMRKPN